MVPASLEGCQFERSGRRPAGNNPVASPRFTTARAAPPRLLEGGRLRILIGVHGLPPFSVGGAELVAWTVATRLARRHQVALFHPLPQTQGPPGTEYRMTRSGVDLTARILLPPARFEDTYNLPAAEAWFESLLEETSPDVVVIHHLTGLSLRLPSMARARGVPAIMTLHDYWPVCARGQLVDIAMRVCSGPGAFRCAHCLSDQLILLRRWGRLGHKLLARLPSERLLSGARKAISSMGMVKSSRPGASLETAGDPEARATAARITAGLDALASCNVLTGPSRHILDTYQPWLAPNSFIRLVRNSVPPRPRVRPKPSTGVPLRLGFLGAIIPTKGVHVLLDACREIPRRHVELMIAGPSPRFHRQPDYAREVERHARDRGVAFLGTLSPEAVPEFVAALDALVVPSLWPENAPRVIGEAFRLGVPVIASDIGGIPEWIVDGENGALVPPGDAGLLRHRIEALLNTPATLRRWAQGAWETRLPSPEEEGRAWEALVEEVTRVGGRRI